MTRFDLYSSEEDALKAMVVEQLKGHEDRLMTMFIQQGPESLRSTLKVPNDFVWAVIFDHLVFNLDVLKRCVDAFFPFFSDFVMKNGPLALRPLFGIEDRRYDAVFEKLLDDLVIARGLIYEYLRKNMENLLGKLEQGQGSEIRTVLGLEASKYDPLWREVLDLLLDSYTQKKVKEKKKQETKTLLSLLQSLLSG